MCMCFCSNRAFLTVCMYACFLGLGLEGGVMGPTIVHMQHLLDTDLQALTLTFTYQRVGYLIGVALSGLLFDRLNHELQFAIACLLEGIATASAPWMPSLYGYYGAMTLQALAHGYINTGGQSFIMGLWEGRRYKQPVIQGGTAMWSLGASICPFLVSPFLVDLPQEKTSSESPLTDNTTGNINETMALNNSNDFTETTVVAALTNIENVRYAYFIVGMCIAVISILFFIAFFLQGGTCENDGVTITQEREKLHGDHLSFKIPMLVLLFFFFVFYIWYEGVTGGLLSVFVIQGLNWPVHLGPLITSVYYGAHGLGRLLGIPISMCLSAATMLTCNLVLTIAAFIVMYFAPLADTDIFMWISAGMAGFAMSTTFASMLLWISNHMTITGAAGSVFLMGTSVGGMTGAALVGYLFQNHTHMWLVYLSIIAVVAHIILFTLMYFIAYCHKRKYKHWSNNNNSSSKSKSPTSSIHRQAPARKEKIHFKIQEDNETPLSSELGSTSSSCQSVCNMPCVHSNSTSCKCLSFQLRQTSILM